jgi:hypothetical protein
VSRTNRFTQAQLDRAADQLCNVYNVIGNNSVCDHWFDEHIPRGNPVVNSFSKRQEVHDHDGRLKFSVSLWATVDCRRPTYPQIVRELRKMARFLETQAAAVERELVKRKRTAARRKAGAA